MVHQYKLNGFNIVLDSCSGAVHDVDEVAYDMIAMFIVMVLVGLGVSASCGYFLFRKESKEEKEEP